MTKDTLRSEGEKNSRNLRRLPIFLCVILCTIIIALAFSIGYAGVDRETSKRELGLAPLGTDIGSIDKNKADSASLKTGNAGEEKNTNKSAAEDKEIKQEHKAETVKDEKEEVTGRHPDREAVSVENAYAQNGEKTVYLTFDDGPSKNITPQVLDILKSYDIKATFFVVGKTAEANPELLRREREEGHSIGNHTYSHDYKQLYSSTENFMAEVKKTEQIFKTILGTEFSTRIIRFPGGGSESYKQPMKAALKENGYAFIDWNTVNGDEEIMNPAADWLFNRVKETAGSKEKLVILMHDSGNKQTTLQALPGVIEYFKERGYAFKALK